MSTAPAASSRCTTVASTSNCWCSMPPAPHVVGYPLTLSRSFAPQGMPCSGPRYLPAAISRSAAAACARARSSSEVISRCSTGSRRLVRARYSFVSSTEVMVRMRSSSASCRTLANASLSSLPARPLTSTAGAFPADVRGWPRHASCTVVCTWAPVGIGLNTTAGATELGRCRSRMACRPARWPRTPIQHHALLLVGKRNAGDRGCRVQHGGRNGRKGVDLRRVANDGRGTGLGRGRLHCDSCEGTRQQGVGNAGCGTTLKKSSPIHHDVFNVPRIQSPVCASPQLKLVRGSRRRV